MIVLRIYHFLLRTKYAGLFFLLLVNLLLLVFVTFTWAQCVFSARLLIPFQNFTCNYSLSDVSPLFIAFGYWLVGTVSWQQRHRASSTAFFLLGTTVLAAGFLSSNEIRVFANLFYVSLAVFSPLLLQFHLALLNRPLRAIEKYSLLAFYLAAIVLAAPFFFIAVDTYAQAPIFSLSVRLLFMISAFWTCLLLVNGYNSYASLASRRRIRMVAFGSLFGFAPLVLLSVLPQTFRIAHVDFNATFPGLLTIPMVYGYVTFRARIPLSEIRFRQLWLYYLLFTTLLSLYTLVAGLMRLLIVQPAWVYTGGVSAILVMILFIPLRNLLNRLVMWIFYGNETDYAQAIHYLEERLSGVIERDKLRSLILEELVAAVRPARGVLFLLHPDGTFHWSGAGGAENELVEHGSIPTQGWLASYLAQMSRPVETNQLLAAAVGQPLSAEETRLLQTPHAVLWLPMVSGGRLYGLLLFGYRAGDDRFTEEDQRLLGRIMHQAGAAIRNVMMAEDLRAGQDELALANQKMILSQEQERRRLARELHDDTVQQLLGLSFRLSGIRKRALKAAGDTLVAPTHRLTDDLELARRDLLDVVSQLRGMIGELRPAGLDELGLRVAIEGYIGQLSKQSENQDCLPVVDVQVDEAIPFLSDALSICLFRTAQEGLRNAFQHARSTHIRLCLERKDSSLVLTLQDNGQGFQPPERLSELTQTNHYGLVGIWERVLAAGGEFQVTSSPGAGTCLQAILPLEEKRDESIR